MGRRKTQEEFEEEVYEAYRGEYTVIGEYINSYTKVQVRHETCGREYGVLSNHFINKKNACPRCQSGGHKNHEDFLYEVNELVGDEYTVLTQYVNRKQKVNIKHNECGTINDFVPANFIGGSRCPKCAYKKMSEDSKGKGMKTQEEFVSDVKDKHGKEYTVVGEYKGSSEYIKIRHNKCGEEYEVIAKSVLGGSSCKKCRIKSRRKTNKQFTEEVFRLVGEEYEFLEDYITSKTHIKVRHNKCGFEWELMPFSFLGGSKCPECSNKSRRKTHEEFMEELGEGYKERYEILGEYVTRDTKIKVLNKITGKEEEVFPTTIRHYSK